MENPQKNHPPRATRRGRRRATRRLVTSALLCALAVVFLGMGALIEVFDLSAAAAASLVLLPVLLCYGRRYAILSYVVASVLGIMLMPQSLGVWMFAGVTGYYPLVKQKLDRLPRVLAWVAKLVILTAVMLVYLALLYFIALGGEGSFFDAVLLGFGEAEGGVILAWATIGLSVATYVLFDVLIDKVLILYYLRWQKRVEKWMGK